MEYNYFSMRQVQGFHGEPLKQTVHSLIPSQCELKSFKREKFQLRAVAIDL